MTHLVDLHGFVSGLIVERDHLKGEEINQATAIWGRNYFYKLHDCFYLTSTSPHRNGVVVVAANPLGLWIHSGNLRPKMNIIQKFTIDLSRA
jgi:hypothetical protein